MGVYYQSPLSRLRLHGTSWLCRNMRRWSVLITTFNTKKSLPMFVISTPARKLATFELQLLYHLLPKPIIMDERYCKSTTLTWMHIHDETETHGTRRSLSTQRRIFTTRITTERLGSNRKEDPSLTHGPPVPIENGPRVSAYNKSAAQVHYGGFNTVLLSCTNVQ